ncbi:i[[h]] channel isoform e [Holotrichia oblita]|uniref:Breakpoint cluster region protein bcr n=2 Tax=Holotrichia oblita TaxID=644536 RepID=A0ACB9TWH4_HOLOL|nr:breakpoint cluster region protein bcr [Holotrichia oblita]KAI4471208.1 i[[h]] channel isoform e [Holotrichia oblita]
MHSIKNRLFAKYGHSCEVTSGWDDLLMYQDSNNILTQIQRQWTRFRMASELNFRSSLFLKSQKAIDAEHRRHLNYLHIIHPFSEFR